MFVFVYSSYHLNLSFPHLVVILTTLETPKDIFCFNNNIMNDDNSKQDHPGKNAFGCTLFAELRGRDTRVLPRIYRLF